MWMLAGSIPALHPERALDHDQPALHLPDPLPAQEVVPGLHHQEPRRGQNRRPLHLAPQYSDRGRETGSELELESETLKLCF